MYYFVRETNSDDSNPGTFEQPFKTITKGIQASGPGDIVYVRQGIYRERVNFYHGGTVDAYFKLAGYPGERPLIDLHEFSSQYTNGINSNEHDYIIIENFLIANPLQFGIIIKNCTGLEIRNVKTLNTKWAGIVVRYSNDVRIFDDEIELANHDAPSAFMVLEDVVDFEVGRNLLHSMYESDIGGIGINVFGASSNGRVYQNRTDRLCDAGIYLDAGSGMIENVDVFANDVRNGKRQGIVLGSEKGGMLKDIRVRQNAVSGCAWAGIRIAAYPSEYSHPMSDLDISYNFVSRNGWEKPETEGGGILHVNPDASDVSIYHNIVSQNAAFQIALRDGAEAVVDDNMIDGFRDADGEVLGSSVKLGDEQFLTLLMNLLQEN